MKTANCEFCGKPFEQIRSTGKYCSPSCRVRACNIRKEASSAKEINANSTQDDQEINNTINVTKDLTDSETSVKIQPIVVAKTPFSTEKSTKSPPVQNSEFKQITNLTNFIFKNKDVVGLFCAGSLLYYGVKLLSQQPKGEKKNETL